MERSESRFRNGLSICVLAGSGSHTTTAASTPGNTFSASCRNSIEPGQSKNVKVSSRYFVVAQLTSTLIWRARASGDESPTVFFCATPPLRWTAPVAARILSSSVVLPLP